MKAEKISALVLLFTSYTAIAQTTSIPKLCAFDVEVSASSKGFPEKVTVLDSADRREWKYLDGTILVFFKRKLVSIADKDGIVVEKIDACSEPVDTSAADAEAQKAKADILKKEMDRRDAEMIRRANSMPAAVRQQIGKVATAKVKRQILDYLKDPDSAKFRRIHTSFDGSIVCGEVNAKNSMGGYVGFQRFMNISADFSGFWIDDGKDDLFAKSWNSNCVNQ